LRLIALAAALILGGLSCHSILPDARLVVTVMQQPEGGYGIDTVRCRFTATIVDTTTDDQILSGIKLSWVWHSPHGTYEPGSYVLKVNREPQHFATAKGAPEFAHLNKPFWLELKWTDCEGDTC
jgi:hypothetical protein